MMDLQPCMLHIKVRAGTSMCEHACHKAERERIAVQEGVSGTVHTLYAYIGPLIHESMERQVCRLECRPSMQTLPLCSMLLETPGRCSLDSIAVHTCPLAALDVLLLPPAAPPAVTVPPACALLCALPAQHAHRLLVAHKAPFAHVGQAGRFKGQALENSKR